MNETDQALDLLEACVPDVAAPLPSLMWPCPRLHID